ncbi:DNA ligase D [Halobacillus yeomjeoni]|uniref:DNA ligase D n=1 Tax=Halobacillus yeomjeoni TaxID=311194 RepID=A0A931MVG4_9BACI|nr:DNA ligase D [Halobacillus yeomjeoni]MBH0230356.1 DNA ligase D [Halobacillus yeomjeoni]
MNHQPMLPSLSDEPPEHENWAFEVKYDGFRAILHWDEQGISLTSRNGKDLSNNFPEIMDLNKNTAPPFFPLTLDGELVILNTPYQANFQLIQQRGRLRSSNKIEKIAQERPATFMAFDIFNYIKDEYKLRKSKLKNVVDQLGTNRIKYVESFNSYNEVHPIIQLHASEGVVAKSLSHIYKPGTRTKHWLKIKNWRTLSGFLTEFDSKNGYYEIRVFEEKEQVSIGKFKHGMNKEEAQTLKRFFMENGERKGAKWHLEPSVCVDVHCLQLNDGELREPMFKQFRFDLSPQSCTIEKVEWDLSLFPPEVETTNDGKRLWPEHTKKDYLLYLREIAPYMLSFMKEKKVTIIRYPDGIQEQSFFQKHVAAHTPEFVGGWNEQGETYIQCNTLSSLLWYGNQGALEYHIPFNRAGSSDPDEIVFDLDPPDQKQFHTAVLAAQLIKYLMDQLHVVPFIKTSGKKGMQVHIPIAEGSMSYEETRRFTAAITSLLIKEKPDYFTVERLKKKRGNRLYLDYVQHGEKKTIIAPYSSRATKKATVATPLYWSEIKQGLDPETFTLESIKKRIEMLGCPFFSYEEARMKQPISEMKRLISE